MARGKRSKKWLKKQVKTTIPDKSLSRRIKDFASKNEDVLRFGLYFLSLLMFFHILFWNYIVHMSTPIVFTGKSLVFFLSLFGVESTLSGSRIFLSGIPLEIIYECTGIYSTFVYTSLILAYPTELGKKGIGIVFGVLGIFFVNLLRLVFLALTGIYYPRVFDFVHIYLWQVSVIVFVVIFWLIWFDKVVKDEG